MIIIGNWKAYVESEKKAKQLVASAKRAAASYTSVDVVLAPPVPYIGLFTTGNKSRVVFASQDLSETTGHAETGEVSAALLADLEVQYSILGHSERRARGESDALVSEKVRRALAQGITPIVCIGERERDLEAQYLQFVREQIRSVMEPLSPKERAQIVLAYEPIWAIGKTALEAVSPTDLTEMVMYIRKALGDFMPRKATNSMRIVYGGSVDATNAKVLATGTGIQGFLIGHASAEVKEFSGIIRAVS